MLMKLAIRNLKLNYKKNFLALLSIVAGFMSVNLFEAYMTGTKELFVESYEERMFYGDYMIHHEQAYEQSIFFDGEKFVDKIAQDKIHEYLIKNNGVEIVVKRLSFKGMITNGEVTTQAIGEGIDIVNARKLRGEKWAWNTSSGHPVNENSNEVIVGEELGKLLNCQNAKAKSRAIMRAEGGYIPVIRGMDCKRHDVQLNASTIQGQANAVFLTVVGTSNLLYREIDSRYLQTNLENIQRLLNTDGVSLITLKLKKDIDKKQFLIDLRDFIKSNKLPIIVASWKDNAFGDIYRQSMSFLGVLRGFFLVVILFIVLFSTIATQNRLVYERIKEAATLRSLGFKQQIIVQIFLTEALILALVGSTIGILLSVIASFLVKKIGIFYLIGILSEEVPFVFSLTLGTALKSTLVLTVLSMVACYMPLKNSLKRTISDVFAGN